LRGRKVAALVAFDFAAILLVACLVALAVWQMHRRTWKLDLIARIEARVHADPVPAPASDRWAGISAAGLKIDPHWFRPRQSLVAATGC
jgi:surfeit locus 1 family protein